MTIPPTLERAVDDERMMLIKKIDETLDYFRSEFPANESPEIWDKPISPYSGGITPNDLLLIRTAQAKPDVEAAFKEGVGVGFAWGYDPEFPHQTPDFSKEAIDRHWHESVAKATMGKPQTSGAVDIITRCHRVMRDNPPTLPKPHGQGYTATEMGDHQSKLRRHNEALTAADQWLASAGVKS